MNHVGPASIIQSDFSSGNHGNLEAVLFRDGQLHHLYGTPGANGVEWQMAQTLPAAASGPGSMIQSDFRSGDHGNFEVVLWSGNELWHWFHNNSDVTLPWQRGQRISDRATGPGAIIQSDFGSGDHGNFEVVVPEGYELVHYFHDNSDVTLPWERGQTISTNATGPGAIIQSDFGSGDHGNFEVVVLEGNDLVHYFHDNSDVTLPWARAQVITPTATGPGSIIQGGFGGSHKNFEVVVLEGNDLVHYYHDNSDVSLPWQRGQMVSVASTGPGCIARSDFGPGGPGNFEVLACELSQSVVHYWHHNVDPGLPWWRAQVLPTFGEPLINSPDFQQTIKVAQLTGEFDRQRGIPTLSQTASRFGVVGLDLGQSFKHEGRAVFLFGDTNTDGNIRKDPEDALDSIASTADADPSHGIRLDFNPTFPHVDNIDQRAFCVPADGVSVDRSQSAPACLIQSDFRDGDHGNFEVVALQGAELTHWWHDNSDVTLPWRRAQTISTQATGSGWIIQSDFHSGDHGNFEVVVLEGSELVHYFHDNSDVNRPWQRAQTISANATSPGCIIQSDFRSGDHGNFEVVVLEGRELVHYFHDNSDVNLPWQRAQTISTRASSAGCIIQSDFRSGDHGNFEVVVVEGHELVHYFHDNSDVNLPWQRGQTISSRATGPGCIIQSDFRSDRHGNFEVIVPEAEELVHYFHDNSNVALPWLRAQTITRNITGSGCIIQSSFGSGGHGNFEVVVPTDGRLRHFFHDNSDVTLPWTPAQQITRASMYVFFTTDRIADPDTDNNSMGRSVLARSEDGGIHFGQPLYDMSRAKFINVSLQQVANADFPGLPDGEGEGILVWGSGGYRRSNVYLAYIPIARIEDRSAYQYFAGIDVNGRPRWASDEQSAVPLFLSGAMGELCVRWNPFLRRFIILYNSDNPLFILEHQSALPWGPWTGYQNIFDAGAAFGHYIHAGGENDGQSDPGREGIGGGVYGPYMISRYTQPNPDGSAKMYFVLSVWNPYNTMLMSAIFRPR
jgi:hypothetical protein